MIVATPTMFLAQGQVQPTYQHDLLDMAEKAQQKVESLFEWIEAQQIDDEELQEDMVMYKYLFEDGKTLLKLLKTAFEEENFESAVENLLDALRIFREVLKAVNTLLKKQELTEKK